MWQYIVIAVILISAIGYVLYRMWQSFRAAKDPCALHDKLKEKQKKNGYKKPVCFK